MAGAPRTSRQAAEEELGEKGFQSLCEGEVSAGPARSPGRSATKAELRQQFLPLHQGSEAGRGQPLPGKRQGSASG